MFHSFFYEIADYQIRKETLKKYITNFVLLSWQLYVSEHGFVKMQISHCLSSQKKAHWLYFEILKLSHLQTSDVFIIIMYVSELCR